MIVEQGQRCRRPNGIAIQVGEHLLRPDEPHIDEENDGDGFVPQFGILVQLRFQSRPPVLSVVNHELGIHRNAQLADILFAVLAPERLEFDLAVDRCRQGRKRVPFRISQQVPSDLGNPCPIQDRFALSSGLSSISSKRKMRGISRNGHIDA